MPFNAHELINVLFLFLAFSAVLYGVNSLLARVAPSIQDASNYWLGLFIVACTPLIPAAHFLQTTTIPNILLNSAYIPSNTTAELTLALTQSTAIIGQSIGHYLLYCCLIISAICLLRFIAGALRLHTLISGSVRVNEINIITHKQQELVERYAVKTFVTSQNISPFVYGFFGNRLVLPQTVFDLPSAQLQLLIDHELMHIKRRDPRKLLIIRLFVSIFWFNPLLRYIEKQFIQSMELNCDADVLRDSPHHKQSYARALIASLRFANSDNEQSTKFRNAGAYFTHRKSDKREFEKRIRQVMSTSKSSNISPLSWSLILAAFLSLSGLSVFVQAKVKAIDTTVNLSSGLIPVAEARVSSGFGSILKIRKNKPHTGIDYAAPHGTEVVASYKGKVIVADDTSLHPNLGLTVLIEHGGIQTLYAHLDSVSIGDGDWVSAGQVIGTVGQSGKATGPHVHFELIQNGERIDPAPYLN